MFVILEHLPYCQYQFASLSLSISDDNFYHTITFVHSYMYVDTVKQTFWAWKCDHFLSRQFKHVFGVLNICFSWEISYHKKIDFRMILLWRTDLTGAIQSLKDHPHSELPEVWVYWSWMTFFFLKKAYFLVKATCIFWVLTVNYNLTQICCKFRKMQFGQSLKQEVHCIQRILGYLNMFV